MACKLSNRNGKTPSSEDFICQHMCNHYRRILNAKKVVDTSPPYSYKTKMPGKKMTCVNGANKPKENRNLSPVMTERSLSTNSYKASSWGTESSISCSRYHANCIPPDPNASFQKQSMIDMKLINQITYDTKNGPAAYCNENWAAMKTKDGSSKKQNVAFNVTTHKSGTAMPASKRPVPMKGSNETNGRSTFETQGKSSKAMSKQSQSFTSFGPKSRPRISKSEAVSKLRSLRVYHPPRRKKKRETEMTWDTSNDRVPHAPGGKTFELCLCSPDPSVFKKPADAVKEQTSSRDSAYNGGVSSLPESRSPTPDHRNKMGCVCGGQSKPMKVGKCFAEVELKAPEENPKVSLSHQETKLENDEAFKKMKKDSLYVKFIQDITVEVLEKGLFTNKAIKKVMKKHIINNLDTLDKDRMIKEVENLRIQLGVPEDKNLLHIDEDNEDSYSIILKAYPVISDSALSLPEDIKQQTNLAGSISQMVHLNDIIDSGADSDDELVSVIQVAKKIRERHPSADSSSEEGNSNRKKRPKVSKFSKPRPEQPRVCDSSSSESDAANKAFFEEPREIQVEGNKSRKSSCMCNNQKKRSVTFDSIKLTGQWDNLVTCSKNPQKTERKMKAKND